MPKDLPAAVREYMSELGKKGGKKGGKIGGPIGGQRRAEKLTARRRKQIARAAARARWSRTKKAQGERK